MCNFASKIDGLFSGDKLFKNLIQLKSVEESGVIALKQKVRDIHHLINKEKKNPRKKDE